MPILHMEFDWCVKKKNVRQVRSTEMPMTGDYLHLKAIWATIAIILSFVEMQWAWNPEKNLYVKSNTCEVNGECTC